MYTPLIVLAALAAVEGQGPLKVGAEELASAPAGVKYEFWRQVFRNVTQERGVFIRMPQADQNRVVLHGYYLRALKKAMLLHRGDAELVDILNTLAEPGADPEAIALRFEDKYHQKFGTWPNLVPVNVDALIERMLIEQEIR